MSTQKQKVAALHYTRVLIFVLSVLAIVLESPYGDAFGILALAVWLWMGDLVSLELKMLDKLKKYRSSRRDKR